MTVIPSAEGKTVKQVRLFNSQTEEVEAFSQARQSWSYDHLPASFVCPRSPQSIDRGGTEGEQHFGEGVMGPPSHLLLTLR
ncbi:hypothetical protein E2C01_096922 [Portunus trituberculatus]|uniref:Uncharacterized protein n=1 Tax=Portunus trituberculatus TaxID=210409 RepID=A0A5B7K4D5_PORTR|nr:hypothetical protein [Portunus trituberculatus]